MKKRIWYIYFYSNYIVSYSLYIYFVIYAFAALFRKSVIYNYILILLFGLYLGYKFADKAYQYLKNNNESAKDRKKKK